MKYSFDLKLIAALTVEAPDAITATRIIRDLLNCADTNFGAFLDGSPALGEVSIDTDAPDCVRIHAIDGEDC